LRVSMIYGSSERGVESPVPDGTTNVQPNSRP
jgi:hypothetical protein